jgi:hypothetical protein
MSGAVLLIVAGQRLPGLSGVEPLGRAAAAMQASRARLGALE